jgi:hypothetical protein
LIFTEEVDQDTTVNQPSGAPPQWGQRGAEPCLPPTRKATPAERDVTSPVAAPAAMGLHPADMSDSSEDEWDYHDDKSDNYLPDDEIIEDWCYEHVVGVH